MTKNISKTVVLGLTTSLFTLLAQNLSAQTESRENRSSQEKPKFSELLSKMDKNKDGKIALGEAEGPMKKDFKTIDANGDGFITEKEFKAAPKPERKGPRPGQ